MLEQEFLSRVQKHQSGGYFWKFREILKSLALQDFMFSEWFESCRFRLDGIPLPADQSNVCSSDGIILLMNCAHNMVLPWCQH
ncbi:hypothetical protein Bca4012_082375 [Brassica carinata]